MRTLSIPARSRPALRAFDPAWHRTLQSPGGRLMAAAGLLLLLALALATVLEPHWRSAAASLDAQRAPQASVPQAPAWPPAEAHAPRVSTLLGLARRHDVKLRGLREAAVASAGDEGVAWRTLTLSAEGRYAALRAFAASALAADAALALDSLVLQRSDTEQGLLRAEFGFAFGHAAAAGAAQAAAPAARRGPAAGGAR
jgi:hypothetical protein